LFSLLRGLGPVQGEWALICTTHNVLKLWRALTVAADARVKGCGLGQQPEGGTESPAIA
jgi:hypothetical protein